MSRRKDMRRTIELIEEADGGDSEDAAYFRVPAPREPSQVYTIRIPVSRIEEIRRVAAAANKQPSALIREWIITNLDILAEAELSGMDPQALLRRARELIVQAERAVAEQKEHQGGKRAS